MHVYACDCSVHEDQNSVLHPLDLKLQAVWSCLTWIPGITLTHYKKSIHLSIDLSLWPPLYILKEGLPLNLELTSLARLADQKAPESLLCSLPRIGSTGVPCCAW